MSLGTDQDAKARRQQAAVAKRHGEPVIAMTFYGHPDGHISMWQHTNHGEDFGLASKLLHAMQEHLAQFIADEQMCPFSPEFTEQD